MGSNRVYFGFFSDDAKKYGTDAAVVLEMLRNALASKYNHRFWAGGDWFVMSIMDWSEYFPHMTSDRLRRAVERLEKSGIVKSRIVKGYGNGRVKMYTINEG